MWHDSTEREHKKLYYVYFPYLIKNKNNILTFYSESLVCQWKELEDISFS